MTAWVRYALMAGLVVLSGLAVWLVRSSPVTSPVASHAVNAFEAETEPPGDSPPLLRTIELNFDASGVQPRNAAQYVAMMELPEHVSKPSLGEWRPYVGAEPVILADADRLWQSGLLESLWVDVVEEPYPNGVDGRRVVFNFVERDGAAVVPGGPPQVLEEHEVPPTEADRVYPP